MCNKEIEMSLIFSSWNTHGFTSHWILKTAQSVVLRRYVSWALFPHGTLATAKSNCFHAYLQKISDGIFSLQTSNPEGFDFFFTSPSLLLVVEREIILFLQIRDKFVLLTESGDLISKELLQLLRRYLSPCSDGSSCSPCVQKGSKHLDNAVLGSGLPALTDGEKDENCFKYCHKLVVPSLYWKNRKKVCA